jgi:hypothetical protein
MDERGDDGQHPGGLNSQIAHVHLHTLMYGEK